MNTLSNKFESVIKQHPELTDVALAFSELFGNRSSIEVDPFVIDQHISQKVSSAEIALFLAALVDEGLAKPRFRVYDNEGRSTDRVFDDYSRKPRIAEDRFLNKFKVAPDNILPVFEIVQ